MQNVYVLSRKVHRVTLFFVVGVGLVMMTTGLMMKYGWSLPFLSLFQVRVIHNFFSIYFVIVLSVMMVTGLYMYIHPYIIRWKNRNTS